jgi:hypothetical protein
MSGEMDVADVMTLLREAMPDWGSVQFGAGRGLARELVIVALLLERASPRGVEQQLARAVRHEEGEGRRSRMAIRKCASEARGLLRYGRVAGGSLTEAADAIEAEGVVLARRVEALVMSVRKSHALEARMANLGGERGGRPPRGALRVLTALIQLGDLAQAGDPRADTELRLIEDYLRRRSA